MQSKKIIILFILSILVSILIVAVIRLADPLLDRFPHLPDQGPSWYFWKLPAPESLARITAWTLYALHQLFSWIFVRSVLKSRDEKRTNNERLTVIALTGNLFFIILHFIQTHLFYDGLAQDVPIFTSQYSVIGMLMIILAMLVHTRGLFFGKKILQPNDAMKFIRRYHGYYISWALVYTFWFHPMDGDWQLVFGFLYMFFLFMQASFADTIIHFSIIWITLLEVFVALHGTTVAILNKQPIWPMFLLGFMFLFVVTQIFGLKIHKLIRIAAVTAYIIGAAIAYYFRGYDRLFEISFIPVTLYAGAILLPIIIAVGQRLVNRIIGEK